MALLTQKDRNKLDGVGRAFLKNMKYQFVGNSLAISIPQQFTGLQFKDRIQQGIDFDRLADVVWDVIEHEHSRTAVRDVSFQLAEGGQQ